MRVERIYCTVEALISLDSMFLKYQRSNNSVVVGAVTILMLVCYVFVMNF